MLRQHVPKQPSVMALLATNGTHCCDRLLRHVRAFRVYDGGCFALVPGEPRLALEDAMARRAYKFLLHQFHLLCLAIAIGCVPTIRGSTRWLLSRLFHHQVVPQLRVCSTISRTPAVLRLAAVVCSRVSSLCFAIGVIHRNGEKEKWHRCWMRPRAHFKPRRFKLWLK
ncbi:hypothetical protein TRVL_06362 [Trypanosoma vivax]|nr:hypothetical protein TRVL_06362 [Trypanosoma vivax]